MVKIALALAFIGVRVAKRLSIHPSLMDGWDRTTKKRQINGEEIKYLSIKN